MGVFGHEGGGVEGGGEADGGDIVGVGGIAWVVPGFGGFRECFVREGDGGVGEEECGAQSEVWVVGQAVVDDAAPGAG